MTGSSKKIRTIEAELLRPGPRHNQLLSPLTRYLGVCGDQAAGIVSVPYEHAGFLNLLDTLRYTVTDEENQGRRKQVLEQVGRELAAVLDQVPGLTGALNAGGGGDDRLTHLRLVVSASELSLLPFEAAMAPEGSGVGDSCLSLRTRGPVCPTRKIRSVPSEGVEWYTLPRVLFISGPEVPFEVQEEQLRRAIEPWTTGARPTDYWLHTLRNAERDEIVEACRANDFTHVHVLAHGALDPRSPGSPFGVLLADGVVSGHELATALASFTDGAVRLPTVVTLATCDSAGQRQVYTPDASVAHSLHSAGVPLVVASQFPLSVAGANRFVGQFYSDQFWGRHPLHTLHQARIELVGELYTHDWASLVVYEALPSDLDSQLEELQYWQSRRAHEAALGRLEAEVAAKNVEIDAILQDIDSKAERLPKSGPYETESAGLRAAGHKRLAEEHFNLSRNVEEAQRTRHLRTCLTHLQSALHEYREAAHSFLVNLETPVQRKANLHWVGIQVLSLAAVLDEPDADQTRANEQLRMAATLAASRDLASQTVPEYEAWALVSLCELAILGLDDPTLSEEGRRQLCGEAQALARKISALRPLESEHRQNTARQLRRYWNWWGSEEFERDLEDFGVQPKDHWRAPGGLIDAAKEVAAFLVGDEVLSDDWKPADVPIAPGERPPRERIEQREKDEAASKSADVTLGDPRRGAPEGDFVLELLPAQNGDCLWLEYGPRDERSHAIIDCGAISAAKRLETRLGSMRGDRGEPPKLDLFVLTHIDSDHISGVVRLFSRAEVEFDDIWFNGWHQLPHEHLDPMFLGVKQGEEYSLLLAQQGRPRNRVATPDQETSRRGHAPPGPIVVPDNEVPPTYTLPGGLALTVLSPGPRQLADLAGKWAKGRQELEPSARFLGGKRPDPIADPAELDLETLAGEREIRDPSVANGSSIALLAEYGGKAALLTGDAHAEVLVETIGRLLEARDEKKLKLDALKLSHHGSANALSRELLEIIECRNYLVSTNGSRFYHPHREAIARVVIHGGPEPRLFFNYPSDENEFASPWSDEELQKKYGFSSEFPAAGEAGIRLKL